MAFPHRGQRSAVCCVTQDEWKLDVAADDFSPSPDSFPKEPMRSAVDKKKLEQLYNRYRDPQDENRIGVDGIQQFCDDLSLDPASASVLVIAWKFRAATQCEFSKKEFVDGMTELGCDSTEKLRALLPRLEQELKDTAKFKDFYQFTFTFAKNPGQKGLASCKRTLHGPRCLRALSTSALHSQRCRRDTPGGTPSSLLFPPWQDLEMAVAYWNLVLSGRFKFLDLWNTFLLMICLTMTKKVREVLVLQMLARNADARAASPCPRGAGRCRPAPPTPAPPLSAVGVTAAHGLFS
ncbi:DCN1-like protein 2 isoform X1 [Ursus maritimus]|uniref:DCN1-like protein n=1 Tax=Ursus maritimus TaxID=29073 RepID=A0A384BM03_URSMA|nr:DCN1-like protein 2 isoform X1 [Ursus maritimus]XP_040480824.1 DCN1-like protein 2 isoform X1 [Ursus maritimus]XP_040480828.1 DCN1-like protein 2 isoform X1 [Ursus maritimus]